MFCVCMCASVCQGLFRVYINRDITAGLTVCFIHERVKCVH